MLEPEKNIYLTNQNCVGNSDFNTPFNSKWYNKKALSQKYKDESKNHKEDFNLKIPQMIEWILMDKKRASQLKRIWSMQNGKNIPICQTKWSYLTLSFQTGHTFTVFHSSVRLTQEQDTFGFKYSIAISIVLYH